MERHHLPVAAADVEVLLTGFEPFACFRVNPSWEIAKHLHGMAFGGKRSAAHLLPVEYGATSRLIPRLWDTYPNIKLCVHCGVGRPGALRIESRARNQEYVRADNSAAAPPSKRVKQGGEDVIHTQVDIERAMEGFRRQLPGVDIEESTEAGLFLCEFSYYTSLHLGRAPTIFLHVPPVDEPHSLDHLRLYVQVLLEHVVRVTCLADGPVPIADAAVSAPANPAPALPPRPKVGLAVIIRSQAQPGKVLLGQRRAAHSDGNPHGKGCFAAPGGHLEFGESFEQCARREVKEECGVDLDWVCYGTTLNVHSQGDKYHYVVIVMVAETSATPENLEPEKCFGWDWYIWGPESLPTPLFSSLVVALDTGFDPLAVEQSSQMQPGTESGAAGRVTKRSRQS